VANRLVANDRTHLGVDTCESLLILVHHVHNCTLTKIVDSGIKVSYHYTSGEKSEHYDHQDMYSITWTLIIISAHVKGSAHRFFSSVSNDFSKK
jgi:hypothetical protein